MTALDKGYRPPQGLKVGTVVSVPQGDLEVQTIKARLVLDPQTKATVPIGLRKDGIDRVKAPSASCATRRSARSPTTWSGCFRTTPARAPLLGQAAIDKMRQIAGGRRRRQASRLPEPARRLRHRRPHRPRRAPGRQGVRQRRQEPRHRPPLAGRQGAGHRPGHPRAPDGNRAGPAPKRRARPDDQGQRRGLPGLDQPARPSLGHYAGGRQAQGPRPRLQRRARRQGGLQRLAAEPGHPGDPPHERVHHHRARRSRP